MTQKPFKRWKPLFPESKVATRLKYKKVLESKVVRLKKTMLEARMSPEDVKSVVKEIEDIITEVIGSHGVDNSTIDTLSSTVKQLNSQNSMINEIGMYENHVAKKQKALRSFIEESESEEGEFIDDEPKAIGEGEETEEEPLEEGEEDETMEEGEESTEEEQIQEQIKRLKLKASRLKEKRKLSKRFKEGEDSEEETISEGEEEDLEEGEETPEEEKISEARKRKIREMRKKLASKKFREGEDTETDSLYSDELEEGEEDTETVEEGEESTEEEKIQEQIKRLQRKASKMKEKKKFSRKFREEEADEEMEEGEESEDETMSEVYSKLWAEESETDEGDLIDYEAGSDHEEMSLDDTGKAPSDLGMEPDEDENAE